MKKAVIVTTDKNCRGVFFGELAEDNSPESVLLANARNVIYWSEKTNGVFGLASIGPQSGSKVGPPVNKLKLYQITSIAECSDQAIMTFKGYE